MFASFFPFIVLLFHNLLLDVKEIDTDHSIGLSSEI